MPDILGITHDVVHDQVRNARLLDDRTPRGVRLGAAQIEAIQRHHRAMSGREDVGPVVEFAGLPVLPSRSADRVVLEYDGDPDDEAPTTVTVPPPAPPAEDQASA